ncbi:MAG: YqgE/AlgH family protein [Candidatus Algichlamydia australiensis]|nr:YqgE/AlgH family protein [Chlamydiales bacterium]
MNPAPSNRSLAAGNFLVASPDISEGLFFRSVILLCEHSPSGSFGLIVNKPLPLTLPEEVSALGNIANPHIALRSGGPMQPEQMMLLHNSSHATGDTLKLAENLHLGGELTFLQQALMDENGPHLLLCFGYSGWNAGFLEREYLAGNWFIHPASSKHTFETPPETLWRTLLREMGGKYASFSMIPDDLSKN